MKLFNKYKTAMTRLEPQDLYRKLKAQRQKQILTRVHEEFVQWADNNYNRHAGSVINLRDKSFPGGFLLNMSDHLQLCGAVEAASIKSRKEKLGLLTRVDVTLKDNSLHLYCAESGASIREKYNTYEQIKRLQIPLPEVYIVKDIMEEIPEAPHLQSWKQLKKITRQILEQRL